MRDWSVFPMILSVATQERAPDRTPEYRTPFISKSGVILMLTLTATQKATLSVEFLDSKGNPASVDGVPVWMTDNSDLLALAPSADGMSCEVSAVGPIGAASAQVTADADLGSGIVNIFG